MANVGGIQRLGRFLTSERSVTSQQIVINVMPTSGYRSVGSNASGDLADATIHEVPRPKREDEVEGRNCDLHLTETPHLRLIAHLKSCNYAHRKLGLYVWV